MRPRHAGGWPAADEQRGATIGVDPSNPVLPVAEGALRDTEIRLPLDPEGDVPAALEGHRVGGVRFEELQGSIAADRADPSGRRFNAPDPGSVHAAVRLRVLAI